MPYAPKPPRPARTSGATSWFGAAPALPAFEPLPENTATDVVVEGGGIAGRTTAHFSNALDDWYTTLKILLGQEGARLAAESHTTAIEGIGKGETSTASCFCRPMASPRSCARSWPLPTAPASAR